MMQVFNTDTKRDLIQALQSFLEAKDAHLIRDAIAKARRDISPSVAPNELLAELRRVIAEVPAVRAAQGEERSRQVSALVEACVAAYYAD